MKTKTSRREKFQASGLMYSSLPSRSGNESRMIFAHRPPTSSGFITAWSPETIGMERNI